MSRPLRLAISTSCFIHVMPADIKKAAYGDLMNGELTQLDIRMNCDMVNFIRDLMLAVNSGLVDALEFYHSPAYDTDALLGVAFADSQVEFWSLHAPYGRYSDPSSPNHAARRGGILACKDTIRTAHTLGAKIVVCHPSYGSQPGTDRNASLARCTESMKEVADYAAERDVHIALEPLPNDEIGNSLEEVLEIIYSTGRKNVGLNFDVNHLFPARAIPKLIRQAGDRLLSIHISDQDGRERHWLPFQGIMDWREVLQALCDIGYKGPLVYEAHVRDVNTCADVVSKITKNYERLIALAPEGARDE